MVRYEKPNSLDAALSLLGAAPWRILSGGTDFYPAQGSRPIRENILDINALRELRGIARTDSHIRIGARTTWSDILRSDLAPSFDALKLAAREVGSVQIQNTGTVAGNLCNASPAADGVPPLLVLDAEVELRAADASRIVPLSSFILGNRRTALQPGELLTAVLVPNASARGTSSFSKLGARRYLVISIAMAAARVVVADGRVTQAAISVGACSAVAQRLGRLEADLTGRPADATLLDVLRPAHFDALSPIDDVRGSASYRVGAAREIVARTLRAALGLAPAELAA